MLILPAFVAPKIIAAVPSVYGTRGPIAAVCLVIVSLAAGWLLGGPQRAYRRTLAMGTALRNVGLCALFAATAFPGGRVSAVVMAYLLVQVVISSAFGVYYKRTAKVASAL